MAFHNGKFGLAQKKPQLPVDPGIQGSDAEKRSFAWKYYGYPELSRWMAASKDTFVLRRFSTLAARTLLYLQHEIAKKDKKLKELDDESMSQPADQGGCDSFDQDASLERRKLIAEMPTLLAEYYNLVNSFTAVRSIPTARDYHIENLQNWNITYPNAVHCWEQHLFDQQQRGDLFPLVSRPPKTPLYWTLERLQMIRKLFRLPARSDRISEKNALNYSDSGLQVFATICAIVMGLLLLFAPMWWLHWVQNDLARLGIMTVAISLFTAWLWVAGATRSFEILAGTAAYAAVLMVYMQIRSDPSNSVPQ